ncbi:MAG: DUF4783 domain-containing protein [Prevotellaceae bacterium]|jgi:uncharacterized membrane protein YvbJ|nr:DUF4783 domain-containing protein [Prevotellaceae bacterium]
MEKTCFYAKKKCKTLILMFLLTSFVAANAQTSSMQENIVNAITKGDAKQIATYFDKTINIVVGSQSMNYDKETAQNLIATFFKSNQIVSFNIIHQGDTEGASFLIGTLKTTNGTFRVYVYVRGKESLIQQIRIEPQI